MSVGACGVTRLAFVVWLKGRRKRAKTLNLHPPLIIVDGLPIVDIVTRHVEAPPTKGVYFVARVLCPASLQSTFAVGEVQAPSKEVQNVVVS